MNQLINIFKILADETRLRMIMLLYQGELCVCQLNGILEISQPRISQNLARLRDLNLVNDERQDKFVYYSLRRDNRLLMDLLEVIARDIADYPVLLSDRDRLQGKESYLNICSAPVGK